MIRAVRPSAMAQDDAALVSGWNVAPNLAYTLLLLPGAASCGVCLYDEDGSTLIASGAALTGTEQPCVLIPQAGQTVGMVDADLGWHLLLTTTGTESQREVRIGPAVDLPDEIHPVYGADDLAVVRATAAIDAAAHYIDEVTVTCPLGLGAGLGDVVSVPVDGVAVVGQVESITWTATPDGTSEQAVIRRHVAIAPEAFVEPVPIVPPAVADDTGETDAATATSGNVLDNDEAGLTVVAVNGLSGNVGVAVDGSDGGVFTIAADGTWTFDPGGDFAALTGAETADTSVTYYASDGTAESMATLTVTVSAVIVAGDPNWSSVMLLMPMDGANNGIVFSDLSAAARPVTRYGHAKTSTEQIKYGTASAYFDGADDYLLLADNAAWDFGSGDFTIEFWGYKLERGGASAAIIIGQADSLGANAASWAIYTNGDVLALVASTGSGSWDIVAGNSGTGTGANAETWKHYAVCRDGNSLRIYVNGAQGGIGTFAQAMPNSTRALTIGRGTNTGNSLRGYLDDLRITKGVCRYPGGNAFTPPSSAHPTS